MTIRARIVGGVTILTAVVFLLAGVATVYTLRSQLVEEIDAEISVRAGGAMQGLGRSPFGPGLGLGPGFGQSIDRVFEERDIAVLLVPGDGDPTIVPAGSFDDPDPLPDLDLSALVESDPFTVAAMTGDIRYRVAIHEVEGGFVVLAATLEATEAAVAALVRNIALVGIGAVLLAGFGAAWIVGRGMQPIDEMIETAERVGDGTLSERVPGVESATEVGHLATAINSMLARVEEAMAVREASEERLRRFASDASHELRTPLTSILGYAELYRQGGDDPDQVARSFQRIESEGARMARMVEDLLLLTRLDQGRGLTMNPVDLRAVVREAVEDAMASDSERAISLLLPDTDVTVNGDEDRLRQVVGNLLTNARDHTPAGTAIEVSLADGHPVLLVVRDEGPGMPEAVAASAFERFARGTSSGTGSGLGLAIVRSIIGAHGGTVTLDATNGTAVTVALPDR